MNQYLLLRSPSANRVYTSAAAALAKAELGVTAAFASDISAETVAAVEYLSFSASEVDLRVLANQSSALALFAREGELLRPIALPVVDVLDSDLVTIPKYQGKTNEQFTKALLNVTLAAIERDPVERLQVLDPMCGRGTTLTTAWLGGHDAYGVELDTKSFEALAAFITTWARRKRLKHTTGVTPVRREGRSIGKRFEAKLREPELTMAVFTGDTRNAQALFGKKKFDAIVTDAPYGVVHGATTAARQRSPETLLREAVPVWAAMLKQGGALGISWNTYSLSHDALAEIIEAARLRVRSGAGWNDFAHRVDSSIMRDLIVATR